MSAILGRKVGMTTVYDDAGRQTVCTVIEAGPCAVTQVKTGDTDGYVFNATAGSAVVISLTSEDFDSLLELEHMGEVVATNDDGGEDFNALARDSLDHVSRLPSRRSSTQRH